MIAESQHNQTTLEIKMFLSKVASRLVINKISKDNMIFINFQEVLKLGSCKASAKGTRNHLKMCDL